MSIQNVFLAMAGVYLFNTVFGWLYSVWPNFDIPMHIAGGFLAALLGLALWEEWREAKRIKDPPRLFLLLFLVCFATLIAVLWEFHEFLLDLYWRQRVGAFYVPMQASLADSMKDLFDGILGALIAVGFLWKKIRE